MARWIPVDERLPDGHEEVLISTSGEYNEVTIAYLNSSGQWTDYHLHKYMNVTAWMPLPKPYERRE